MNADQRRRGDQRPQDQAHHRDLRPHQRSRTCGPCASSGPREPGRRSPWSTGSGPGPGTTSCASPRRATPRSSGSGRPSTNLTKQGAPYLWWTGPDQASILATLVSWGKCRATVERTPKVGIVAGDRASDQVALERLPAARPATGRDQPPRGRTIDADPSDTAATGAAAPLIVQRAAGGRGATR